MQRARYAASVRVTMASVPVAVAGAAAGAAGKGA